MSAQVPQERYTKTPDLNEGRFMSKNDQISLKTVSYMMLGGGAIALALVAAVWGILGIFVI